MNRSKKIFIASFFIFLAIVFFFTWDFMRKTTAPWEKKKELIQKYKVK